MCVYIHMYVICVHIYIYVYVCNKCIYRNTYTNMYLYKCMHTCIRTESVDKKALANVTFATPNEGDTERASTHTHIYIYIHSDGDAWR